MQADSAWMREVIGLSNVKEFHHSAACSGALLQPAAASEPGGEPAAGLRDGHVTLKRLPKATTAFLGAERARGLLRVGVFPRGEQAACELLQALPRQLDKLLSDSKS